MRVTLTGTYSSWNKGDAAMELATLQELQRVVPGVEVVVSSPFADHDRPTYAPARVVQCNRRGPLGFVQLALAVLVRLLGPRPWLLVTEELEVLTGSDLVVDLSGDMLTEDYGVLVAVSHYLPLLTAWLLGVRYVVCAQSIGPFVWTAPVAHFLLRQAAVVTVRESITAERLRPVRPDLELTADMAYLLEPTPDRVPADVELPEGPLLGVSVSELVAGKHQPAGKESFDDELVAALEELGQRLPHRAVFFAHVTGPGDDKDDRLPARRIAHRLGTRATVVEADLPPAAIKALIARCHVFVGARMHANIAALTSGVPVVALRYSHKADGIMAEFGQSDVVIEVATLDRDDLVAAVMRLVEHNDQRREALLAEGRRLRALAALNVERIVDLLPRR